MPRIAVFLVSTLTALLILWLGSQMPETVASHFGVSGAPDSTLPTSIFVPLYALLCATVPTFVWWLQVRAAARGQAKIPTPSRWFAAPERENTEQFLSRHAAWFSSLLAVFFAFVFWLVFQANTAGPTPVPLQMRAFFLGLLVFLLLTAGWLYAIQVRFGRKDA